MAHCPKCGAKLKNSNPKFCPECGYKIENGVNIQIVESKQTKYSNKKIIPLVIIIVIIAIVGAFLLGSSDFETSINSTNETSNNHSGEKVTPAETSVEYVASTNSDKFHLTTCKWADKISEKNKIVYPSRQAAVDGGKTPCKVCDP